MAREIVGIVAPITTPFEDEEVAYDKFRANMKKYAGSPLHGLFVLGSNGENRSLTEEEKSRLLEIALEEKGQHQYIMAGTSYESTRETIAASRRAQEMGVDLVSLLSPGYFKKSLTDEALYGYYADVADALDIPVFAYNAPGFTGITLSPKLVKRMSQHPNIAGMKDSSPAGLAGYLNVCGDDFAIFSGTINTLFMGLVIGVKGGVVSLANAFPEPCCALYERFIQGDLEEARALHGKLFGLNQAVSGKHGVAGVKYCMDLAGFHGTAPRLPLLPLAEDAQKSIRDAVSEVGFN